MKAADHSRVFAAAVVVCCFAFFGGSVSAQDTIGHVFGHSNLDDLSQISQDHNGMITESDAPQCIVDDFGVVSLGGEGEGRGRVHLQ